MSRINIFGSSERLLEIGHKKIKSVLSLKSPSVGINLFINEYPEVKYFCFSDGCTLDYVNYKGQKIITNQFIYDNYLIKDSKYKIECVYEPNNIKDSVGNSAFFAIWWAVNNGYKEIYLYGIMDGDYKHISSGEIMYRNVYTGNNHYFQNDQFNRLSNIINTGYNGRVKILRPLMK